MNKKLQKAELDVALVKALVEEPHKSYRRLANEFGTSINYITGIVQRNNLRRKRGRGSPAWRAEKSQEEVSYEPGDCCSRTDSRKIPCGLLAFTIFR